MYRKVSVVSIVVLLLSLAFASVTFAQTGSGDQGTGPSNAYSSPPDGSRALGANEQQWYAFQYAGDNSPIQIRLGGTNMQFSVWTQQDVQNAAGDFGSTSQPVGRSTTNSQMNDDQYWTGSFNVPGTYYIMVENANGGQGGNYALQVTGSGVSWQGQSASNTSGSNTNESGGIATGSTSGTAPTTLPQTGGEMASVVPMLIGGLGALSVATGVMLRRKK